GRPDGEGHRALDRAPLEAVRHGFPGAGAGEEPGAGAPPAAEAFSRSATNCGFTGNPISFARASSFFASSRRPFFQYATARLLWTIENLGLFCAHVSHESIASSILSRRNCALPMWK